jgi:hypothetical protein
MSQMSARKARIAVSGLWVALALTLALVSRDALLRAFGVVMSLMGAALLRLWIRGKDSPR